MFSRAIFGFLASALFHTTALAASLIVTSPGDTPAPGTTTLREAVAVSAPDDIITFAVAQPILLTEGEIVIDHDLVLQGPDLGTQAILRESGPPSRLFHITGGVVSFSHLTLRNGYVATADSNQLAPPEDRLGGAILNAGSLTLTSCFFLGNSVFADFGAAAGEAGAEGKGGAIFNLGTLDITGCSFDGNVAAGGAGGSGVNGPGGAGGLSAGGALFNAGTATISNSTFTGCSAIGSAGGSGSPDESNGQGSSAQGGAVFNAGTLAIKSSTFSQNAVQAGNAGRGGIQSDQDGGDAAGGAIHAGEDPAATTKIQSTLVARSFIHSGASSNYEFSGARGAALGRNVFGSVVSEGYNLIEDASESLGWVSADQVGTLENPIDPLLQTFAQNNGGPTETLSLKPGSPAIDQGNSPGLTNDERGRARIFDDPAVPNAAGGDGSDVGAFELQPAPRSNFQNVSTRAPVGTDEFVLIGGVIFTGQETKTIVFRALGPYFDPFLDPLPDPVLELHNAEGVLIATNDNWTDSQAAALTLADLAPVLPNDAAILTDLTPGSYTAIVHGHGSESGIAVIEAYDLDPYSDSALANISARGKVDPDDGAMIAGFILGAGGGGSTNVAVRALGSSLGFGLAGLQDPTLQLYDADGFLLASNDDWKATQEAEITAAGLALRDDREAALIIALPPGPYTAVVRGKSDASGIALVEVYRLE